jgi:ribA/ribD-fused uncharacterized protein
MTATPAILFGGDYFWWCSNFAAFRMIWGGLVWDTSEHIYQAEKFTDPALRAWVREAESPHEAKRRANERKDAWRPDWYAVRDSIMEKVVAEKARQHPWVARKLEATGDREIVENAPWDEYWGNGKTGTGLNKLGKTWMKVRADRRIAAHV